jgi:non-ribosomal peptide synthetase component F
MGGQVTLLHPNGNLSMNVFCETINYQQVTCLNIVPSLLIILTNHLRSTKDSSCLKTLRCVSAGGKNEYFYSLTYRIHKNIGESLMANSVADILPFVNEDCHFYNNYGPVEYTGAAIQYLISSKDDIIGQLPIGQPMPNVHIYLLDDYDQPVIHGIQIGEIVIGGNIYFTSKYTFQ